MIDSNKNRYEYINDLMLEDLGFERITHDHGGSFDMGFESGYRHPWLDPFNMIIVDYKNGAWHFAQRVHAMSGLGKMVYLDDLVTGFRFITGKEILNYRP